MLRIITATGFALALTTGAWADAILTTPPVVQQSGEGITCIAVNVGSVVRAMKADVMEAFSNTPLDSEQADVNPGGIVSASGDGNYCRFTVDKKNDARAAAHVRNNVSGATLAVIGAQ